MRNKSSIIAMLAVVVLGLWPALAPAAEEERILDGVAAYVEDEVVTIGDVREMVEPLLAKLRQRYQGEELAAKARTLYQESLDSFIERKLILKAYKKKGGELPAQVVDRRIGELIHERFGGDRAVFLEALEKERLTYDEWRQQVREMIIINSMKNLEVDSRVMISPTETRRLYDSRLKQYEIPEKVRIRVILVHAGQTAEDQPVRRKLVEETAEKIGKGEDFAQLAKQVSEDGKAAAGGDWGWMEPGELRAELAAAVGKLEPGTTSPVIAAGDDYYLIKLEERKKAALVPFTEVQTEIEKELRRKETVRLLDAWIQRLKKEFHVTMLGIEGT